MSHIRVREFEVRAVSGQPTPEDLAIISGPDFAGRAVSPEEIVVRRARLAHNQHDRTGERFPKGILERFAETAPGKSVLMGHDTGSAPVGMFFGADVRSRQEAAFEVIAGSGAGTGFGRNFRWETRAQRVTWLETDFYAPAGGDLARNVDLGIWKWVSIGFRFDDLHCDVCGRSYWGGECPHIIGRATEDGKVVTATYAGDPAGYEMLEGSIVYLGAQQQARLVKQVQAGRVDVESLCVTPWGEDLVLRKEAEFAARHYGHAHKSWAFPALAEKAEDNAPVGAHTDPAVAGEEAPAPVGAPNPEEGDSMAMTDEERAAYEAAQKRAADAEQALAEEKAAREKVAADLAEANAKAALAGVGEQALKDLQDEILRLDLALTGKAENPELGEVLALNIERRNYARLREIAEQKQAAVNEKYPAGLRGDPDPQPAEEPRSQGARPQEYHLL